MCWNFAANSRAGLVPVTIQPGLPGVRASRGALGPGRFRSVCFRRPFSLGRRARLDRDRLLYRSRRMCQLGAVVPPAPTPQPSDVLRLFGPPHHHDHDQLPNGRPSAPPQSDHGKCSNRIRIRHNITLRFTACRVPQRIAYSSTLLASYIYTLFWLINSKTDYYIFESLH